MNAPVVILKHNYHHPLTELFKNAKWVKNQNIQKVRLNLIMI